MAQIFITGSSDGLGLLAAKELIALGHNVVLHARSEERGKEALAKAPGASTVVTGDLSDMSQTMQLASKVNKLDRFDAVIHNAGVYQTSENEVFMVNTIAPYILTCLIEKPARLIYLSSGMHLQGRFHVNDIVLGTNRVSYSDSKLHVLLLCKSVARLWPHVYANAVDPGWVPTKMGGRGAPDDLKKGYETQVWLATSNEGNALVSGRYFHHEKESRYNAVADDITVQDQFLNACRAITGIQLY